MEFAVNPMKEINDPKMVVRKVIDGDADAVATFGVIGVPREAQLSKKNGKVREGCEVWV